MLAASYLNLKEKNALLAFKRKASQAFPGQVIELKLFGSKARGDYHRESDTDVLLVLHDVTENKRNKICNLVLDILHEYQVYLSVHVYSEKEFVYLNRLPTVFMQFIQEEAVKI